MNADNSIPRRALFDFAARVSFSSTLYHWCHTMADPSKCPPLIRASVQEAHERIKPYIHRTPVLTCQTLDDIASTSQTPEALGGTEWEGQTPSKPKINLFFKCENYQKIGAFKARGAFHALSRLSAEELGRGVVTHSSGIPSQSLPYLLDVHG